MSDFSVKLKTTLSGFRNDAISSIEEGPRQVPRSEGNNTVNVTSGKVKSGLTNICPSRNFEAYKESFFCHFSELNRYLTLCSSPQSFEALGIFVLKNKIILMVKN